MDSGPNAKNLLCEYAENPIAIDVLSPRLSWAMEHGERDQTQTAYQILVSRDLSNLNADRGEMWDSGQVPSAQSVNVIYAGAPLEDETFLAGVSGIHAAHREGEYVRFPVGSGSYEFEIQNEGA